MADTLGRGPELDNPPGHRAVDTMRGDAVESPGAGDAPRLPKFPSGAPGVTLGGVLVAFLVIALPGLGLAFALLPPDRTRLPIFCAAVIPFGYAFLGLTGLALALGHVMTAPAFFALSSIGTLAVWGYAVRGGAPRAHARSWRPEVARERWSYLTILGILVVLAVVRAGHSPLFNLSAQTPFRYWADGIELANAHRVPTTTLQWGVLVPSTVSKVLLNAFEAGMSFALGRGPFGPMGSLLFLCSMGIFLAAYGLAVELGLRLTAPLVPILLFADRVFLDQELTADLNRYHAENFGRLVMLAALMFSVRAMRAETFREGRRDAVLAGALFGVGAGTHLVPTAVGGAFAASYWLARLALDRRPVPLLQVAAATTLVAGAVGAFVLFAPRGDIGFKGAADTGAYASLAREVGQPANWDPTLYFATGQLDQSARAPARSYSVMHVYRDFVKKVGGHRVAHRRTFFLLPIGAALSLGMAFAWGSRDVRALSVSAFLFGLVILAVAFVFASVYRIYVLQRFGERRLFDYALIPVVLLALAAIEVVLPRLSGRLPVVGGRLPWLGPAATATVVALVCAIVLPKAVAPRLLQRLKPEVAPLAWIEQHVPCDGRILADRRSLATFELLTRRAGVLEGMGPYLRPDLLVPAIREMLAARGFFADPAAGEDYLRANDVAAVVLSGATAPIGGTAYTIAPTSREAMAAVPFLREVAFSKGVTVYQVVGFDPSTASSYPSVVGRPGYECTATG